MKLDTLKTNNNFTDANSSHITSPNQNFRLIFRKDNGERQFAAIGFKAE